MQSVSQPANQNHARKSAPEPALLVEGLSYKIHPVHILKDIHFLLDPGEVLTLMGPNGAGKSTLLKCLAGLLPHSGTRQVFGTSLKRNYPLRQKLGYLGHETFLYMKLSARENLLFYSSLYGLNIDTDQLLREYQLIDFADQPVETFSRGMKQRLALARALLASPELILLDEPFTGLDQQASHLLYSKILELKGKVAFVLTTHELRQGFEICDKILILKNGKQVFWGNKTEVQSDIYEFYRQKTT